jgi:hypothetical protein
LSAVNVFVEDNIMFQGLRNSSGSRLCIEIMPALKRVGIVWQPRYSVKVSCSCSRPVCRQCLYGREDGRTDDCKCCHHLGHSVNKSITLVGITAFCSSILAYWCCLCYLNPLRAIKWIVDFCSSLLTDYISWSAYICRKNRRNVRIMPCLLIIFDRVSVEQILFWKM